MNIIITGASRGIGLETALLFARERLNTVVAISRNPSLQSNLRGNIHWIHADLSTPDPEQTVLQDILKLASPIDLLIHNAGTLISKPFVETTEEDWRQTFEINFFGVVRYTKMLLPYFSKTSQIIHVSSMAGYQGISKVHGLSAYSSSKGALTILTECLALELAPNQIHVNCICPGGVQTEMFETAFKGVKAKIKPDEMARWIFDFSETRGKRETGLVVIPDIF